MVKSELIKAVAERIDFTMKDTDLAINTMLDIIGETLKNGDEVSFVGFGTFSVTNRAGRIGVNPQTKDKIQIAATRTPHFKTGKGLKDLVN